jgi:transcriptional regulator with XRE-family HTH domain
MGDNGGMATANTELGAFLRARRDRLAPSDAGVPTYGRRRVPGLRREELAQLAGVSADYLVRLEQGRDIHPSAAVLDALANALSLDADERAHLHALGRATQPGRPSRRRTTTQRVRPEVRWLLADTLDRSPALVLGRRMEVLAHNPMAGALMGDLAGQNFLRLLFLDDAGPALYPDWDDVAADSVGFLRLMAAGRHDAELCELVGELSLRSPAFARLWADHHVRDKTTGTKRFDHPLVGELALQYETLRLSDSEQWLVVYTAQAGSAARTALDLLGAISAPQLPVTG